jgi:hypothetical protein
LKIEHVKSAYAFLRHFVVTDIAVVASNSLVTARTKSQVALAGKDDHPYLIIVSSQLKSLT